MDRTPELGDIVEGYCERCRLNLDLSVAVITEGIVKQVQCRTCNNFVPFRAVEPESVRKERVFKRVLNMRDRKTSRSRAAAEAQRNAAAAATDSAATASASIQARREARARWETLTDGVDSTRALPYRPQRGYSEGDFILHKAFGMGYVESTSKPESDTPPQTALVVFRTGERQLPINQPSDD